MSRRRTFNELSLLKALNRNNNRKILDLPEEYKEVFCELSFDDEPLKKIKQEIAADLVHSYKKKPDTIFNLKKIDDYDKIANDIKEEKKPNWIIRSYEGIRQCRTFVTGSLFAFKQWYKDFDIDNWWQETVADFKKFRDDFTFKKAIENVQKWIGSDFAPNAFLIQGWFTSFRLFLLRVNRVSILTHLVNPVSQPGFKPYMYFIKIGGLSYFLSLLADILVIVVETFIVPLIDGDDKRPYWKKAWERFISVMNEDRRLYRMANDALWVTINAIGIFMTGPYLLVVNAIINVVGFGFDFCNDLLLAIFSYLKYANPKELISNRIKAIQHELKLCKKDQPGRLTEEQVQQLDEELAQLKIVEAKLEAKRKKMRNDKILVVVSVGLIVVGMVLVFFPPAALPGATIMGAAMALFFGSIIISFGKRMLDVFEDLCKDVVDFIAHLKKPPAEKKEEVLNPLNNKPSNNNGPTGDSVENLARPIPDKTEIDVIIRESSRTLNQPKQRKTGNRSFLEIPDSKVYPSPYSDLFANTPKEDASRQLPTESGLRPSFMSG